MINQFIRKMPLDKVRGLENVIKGKTKSDRYMVTALQCMTLIIRYNRTSSGIYFSLPFVPW